MASVFLPVCWCLRSVIVGSGPYSLCHSPGLGSASGKACVSLACGLPAGVSLYPCVLPSGVFRWRASVSLSGPSGLQLPPVAFSWLSVAPGCSPLHTVADSASTADRPVHYAACTAQARPDTFDRSDQVRPMPQHTFDRTAAADRRKGEHRQPQAARFSSQSSSQPDVPSHTGNSTRVRSGSSQSTQCQPSQRQLRASQTVQRAGPAQAHVTQATSQARTP